MVSEGIAWEGRGFNVSRWVERDGTSSVGNDKPGNIKVLGGIRECKVVPEWWLLREPEEQDLEMCQNLVLVDYFYLGKTFTCYLLAW